MTLEGMFSDFAWHNVPPWWRAAESGLKLVTANRTDFWQTTFYGFERDNGHAFLKAVRSDFTVSAKLTGAYEQLYDQMGVMLRVDERFWIKAGVEFTDGLMHLSTVVTREASDWSVVPLPSATPKDEVAVRLTRHGGAIRVQFSIADAPWQLARLSPFPDQDARAGIMACSPEREGFTAQFWAVTIGPPIARQLHAD